MSSSKSEPCRCDAYPFPHRELGGQCKTSDSWNGRPDPYDQYVARMEHEQPARAEAGGQS